jgi:hypothetical protein
LCKNALCCKEHCSNKQCGVYSCLFHFCYSINRRMNSNTLQLMAARPV